MVDFFSESQIENIQSLTQDSRDTLLQVSPIILPLTRVCDLAIGLSYISQGNRIISFLDLSSSSLSAMFDPTPLPASPRLLAQLLKNTFSPSGPRLLHLRPSRRCPLNVGSGAARVRASDVWKLYALSDEEHTRESLNLENEANANKPNGDDTYKSFIISNPSAVVDLWSLLSLAEMGMERSQCWVFMSKGSGMKGRPSHLDSLQCDFTYHAQVLGEKTWILRGTEAVGGGGGVQG